MIDVNLQQFFDWFSIEGRTGRSCAAIGFKVSGYFNLDICSQMVSSFYDEQLPDDCVFLINGSGKTPPKGKNVRMQYYDYWLNRKGYTRLRPILAQILEGIEYRQRPDKTPEEGEVITIEMVDKDFEKFIKKYER